MNAEFICTNKYAGYCSFDLSRGNTRKYHGLLVNAGANFERKVLVAGTSDFIQIGNEQTNISNSSYLGHTTSFASDHLEYSFELPYPTQIFRIGPVRIRRQIIFSEHRNEVTVEYEMNSPLTGRITIYPLLTYRDIDEIGLSCAVSDIEVVGKGSMQEVTFPNYPEQFKLEITSDLGFELGKATSSNHYYQAERDRGYIDHEDLAIIGNYSAEFPTGISNYRIKFKANTHNLVRKLINFGKNALSSSTNYSVASDVSRFDGLYPLGDKALKEFLVINARKFLVTDGNRTSVIAGYHWFSDWGRDTFISFKGLLLGLGRFDQAQTILSDWSRYISSGLLPNTMETFNYNSIDAIHWYSQAIWEYFEQTGDYESVLDILPKLERAVYALAQGSKYGISLTKKGYLVWSDETQALSWMDAKVEGKPVINRSGAAVEIQALWYNTLKVVEQLTALCGYRLLNQSLFGEAVSRIQENFIQDFWIEDKDQLADFIDNSGSRDFSLRPNQLIATSLPFRLVNREVSAKIIAHCEQKLLTEVGLKTLSSDHPDFKGQYRGNQTDRDLCYHQGTIWPWLFKPYFNSLAANLGTGETREKISRQLDQAWQHISDKKLSSVPEIFETSTLEPRGAISQAWSVAALIEGIMLINQTEK